MSLRTRLAAVKLAQRNVSIDMDNSLTGSTSMVSQPVVAALACSQPVVAALA